MTGDHRPVCQVCGEDWPCRERQIENEVMRYAYVLRRTCVHCKTFVENGHRSLVVGGSIYHWAKRHKGCREAAMAARERAS